MWTDLFLDDVVEDESLAQGLAHVFAVRPSNIGIVDDIGAVAAEMIEAFPVRVERSLEGGDLPFRVSVFLDRTVQPQLMALADEESAIARLCAFWQRSCLFSDDDANPYSWLLMRPTGTPEAVTVDADRLDERDQLVVAQIDRLLRRVSVPA